MNLIYIYFALNVLSYLIVLTTTIVLPKGQAKEVRETLTNPRIILMASLFGFFAFCIATYETITKG